MKKTIFLTLIATLFSVVVLQAQERYDYTVSSTHKRSPRIDWQPRTIDYQRYTLGVNIVPLLNHGLKFDFEFEIPNNPGHWLQLGVAGHFSPALKHAHNYFWYDRYDNYRSNFMSGFDDYIQMWGAGVHLRYKWMFSRKGWYLSPGISLEYFRVERTGYGLVEYREDNLSFWEEGKYLSQRTYYKPSIQFNIGKHFAVSRRCFFDLYGGIRLSYSIYKPNSEYYSEPFHGMFGFAHRGLDIINGGIRFGVLLLDNKK